MRPFPWDEAMRLGFGVMRLSSRDFWGLTPRELATAFGGGGGRGSPPSRSGLDELMRRYPDEVSNG
ncbi:MAG TPA: rcc01693 family protein [Devosia sp.]